MTGTTFRDRLDRVVKLVGSAAELARRSRMSDRSIRSYLAGDTEPKGEVVVRLAAGGGVRVEWLLTGTGPMTDELPRAEQPPASYQAADPREVLREVSRGVDEFLAGRNPTHEERGQLLELAFDYMVARGTTDRDVLMKFLKQVAAWARSAAPQPAAGIPAADDVPSQDLTRTFRDGEAPSAPPAKKQKGEE